MTDVVCCLTPPGVAALAVVALKGPSVWTKLSPFFRTQSQAPSGPPWIGYGRLQRDDLGDDVVLVLRGDARYPIVEVQTHGGPGVVNWLLSLAEELGCQRLTWEEWVSVDTDGHQALWAQLPHAITKRTAAILLDQCQGAFDRELARIRSLPDPQCALEALAALRRWQSLGAHLFRPWKVALAGPPNAGKSSLFNTLLGFDRAITAPTPGTTRDVVTATLIWHGFPLELFDTAGLRETHEELEAAGIARARHSTREADVVLWLIDLAGSQTAIPPEVTPTFLVGSKSDLPRRYVGHCHFEVSAVTGAGLPMLLDAILRQVLPDQPTPGQAIPVLPEQVQELEALDAFLKRA